MNIIVYSGPGAAPAAVTNTIATLTPILSPYYSITTVSNPNVFITDPWQPSTALIVFPGGRDIPYCQSLNGSPNAAISSWVRYRGGKFLGFCAGGYYGSKRCEFEIGDKVLEVVGSRELGFFPGTCRGSAFEGFVYDKEDGAKAAGLKIEEGLPGVTEDVKAYCNGGGIYVDADNMGDKGVTVLARFTDKVKVEGGDVAAVYCKVGNGAAILTGVHPEIRAAQLNKADGGQEFVKLIDDLLAHDAGRNEFLRALLVKLGLKVSPESGCSTPRSGHILTPIHISSSDYGLTWSMYNSLLEIADTAPRHEGAPFTITDANDTFHLQYITSSLDSMRDLRLQLNGHYPSNSVDPSPKHVFLHSSPMTYSHFSPKQYFQQLSSSSKVGQVLAYAEVTSSTQTLLDKNPSLLRALPPGFVVTATTQLNGRGRAGNAWISPIGGLAFSYVLRLPIKLSNRLVFVQYLVTLAVVEGIKSYAPGWEDVNVAIKWPNDVYGKPRGAERWEKIGGIIINSTYLENEYVLVVGIGLNTTNPHPTTSLLHIIPEDFAHPTFEQLLAKILSVFSDMYTEFLKSGFVCFEDRYYKRWLHDGQIVSIENGMTRGKIRGVDFKDGGSGGLLVDEVDMNGRSLGKKMVEVVADGNSFDMMKGLLRRKR